jgi:hypothetical protein
MNVNLLRHDVAVVFGDDDPFAVLPSGEIP